MNDPLGILGDFGDAPSPVALSVHSTLGPSNAERWVNCPGSVAASAGLSSPGNKYSAEGTVAHALAEELVTGKTNSQALMKRIGDTVMEDGFEVEITEEMVEAAIEYHDLIVGDTQVLNMEGKPASVQGHAEVKVTAKSIDEEGEVRGTADYILFQKGNKLKVYDFKYGKKAVEAKENKQMAIYALAAMDTIAGYAYDDVELIIVQPRAGGVRRWTAPVGWLTKFAKGMKAAAIATRSPTAERRGGKWCTYCPAEATCPAARGAVEGVFEPVLKFEGVAPVKVKGQSLPAIEHLSVERMAEALDWEDMVNSYFEAIKLRIRAMLDAGERVPGYKLVDGKSNRKWTDEAAVVAEFAPTLGEDALFVKKIISPAALEKIVGKKNKLDHLTFKPEGKRSIAKESDPRPAARGALEDTFTAIVEQTKELGVEVSMNVFGTAAVAVPDLMGSLMGEDEDPLGLGAVEPKSKQLWPS